MARNEWGDGMSLSKRNPSGCMDLTAYDAIRNVDREIERKMQRERERNRNKCGNATKKKLIISRKTGEIYESNKHTH
jgi:hypothetical protein